MDASLPKTAVLASVETLRTTFAQEPASDLVRQALHQCHVLQQAITLSHAEAIRFASFTLLRFLDRAGEGLSENTRSALRDLRAALEAAGYPH